MESVVTPRHSISNLRICLMTIGVVLCTLAPSLRTVDGMYVRTTQELQSIPGDKTIASRDLLQEHLVRKKVDEKIEDNAAQSGHSSEPETTRNLGLLSSTDSNDGSEFVNDVTSSYGDGREGLIANGEYDRTIEKHTMSWYEDDVSTDDNRIDTDINSNNNNSIEINNNSSRDSANDNNSLYFQPEHSQQKSSTSADDRILSEVSRNHTDSNYDDSHLDFTISDTKMSSLSSSPFPNPSSLSSSSSSSSSSSWSWLYSWIIPEIVVGSRSRSKRSSGDGQESSLTSEFIMVMNVPHLATSSNSSIDATILRLKHALSKEIPWSERNIHVNELSFPASQIEFYFQDGEQNLVPIKMLLSNDLASRVSSHVPDLDLSQFVDQGSASSIDDESIWETTYFPWAVAAASVAVVLMIVVGVYLCCRRKKVPEDPVDAEDGAVGVVVSHSIHYPTLKPELGEPTPVQPPDLQLGGFPSPPGLTSPVLTQPIRIKGKGLLERRGSNASLTLDLNPCNDTGRWEGTPPKESTALEFLMSAGNRLSRRDLRNAVKNSKALYEEFWEIPMNHTEKVCVAGSGVKNRYKTIIPNEHSRVILPDIDDDPLNSYINANYIRGYEGEPKAYIATQGPMAHTILDFWRMVWFEKCAIIVMITKLKEKSKPKCENYLPEKSGQYGDVEVVIEKIIVKKGYILRHITLKAYGESQSILHYWYTAWPDHKPPESPHMLLDLVKEVELRRFQPNGITSRGPVCVHCSAGIGRTGCFVAISIGIRQLREEHSVDALGIVCAMRIDRGGLIQTHEQYDFIHQALAAYERELGESSVQSITALTSESVTTP